PDRARRGGMRRRCPHGPGGPRRAGRPRNRLHRDPERPRRNRPDHPGPMRTQRAGAGEPPRPTTQPKEDATMVSKQEQQEARERLRKYIKPGDTIYCILRHVSRSGMTRVIDLVTVRDDGEILHIGYNAAAALGWTYDREREGVRVSGCGMDMGFHLVYSLAHALFSGGQTVAERSEDAGYSLTHRW